jgi:hypothetical protein
MIIFGNKIAMNITKIWGIIRINFTLFFALFAGSAMGPTGESVG